MSGSTHLQRRLYGIRGYNEICCVWLIHCCFGCCCSRRCCCFLLGGGVVAFIAVAVVFVLFWFCFSRCLKSVFCVLPEQV